MRLPFRKKRQEREGLASPVFDEFRAVGGYGLKPLLFPPSRFSAQLLASLPPRVLERIFVFVCPHAVDDSYETCEKSANEKGCMLCDLRDLSRCVQVNRAWRATAIKILYACACFHLIFIAVLPTAVLFLTRSNLIRPPGPAEKKIP